MNPGLARTIELNVDRGASATFAAAVAFAAFAVIGGGDVPLGLAAGLLAASAAYPMCRMILGAVADRGAAFNIPAFEVAELNVVDELILTEAGRLCDELVLTDADKLCDELLLTESDRWTGSDEEPLILDDIADAIGPDSRVVRLFDRRAMRTAGDLKATIDNHVEARSAGQGFPDASQELSDALAELRKALR